jgi:hypothetical protein
MPTRKTPALQRMCVMRLIFNLYSPIITLPWLQVYLLWLQSVHVATLFNVSSFTTHHPARSCSLSLLSEGDRDLDNSTPSSQFALGFQVKRAASAAIGILAVACFMTVRTPDVTSVGEAIIWIWSASRGGFMWTLAYRSKYCLALVFMRFGTLGPSCRTLQVSTRTWNTRVCKR